MTYEEFEWHILRLVYEDGMDRLQPSYIAYSLGLPHEKTTEFLDRATQNGVLDMDVTEDGCIEYFVPGYERERPLPRPLWKDEEEAQQRESDEGLTQESSVEERVGASDSGLADQSATDLQEPTRARQNRTSAESASRRDDRQPERDGTLSGEEPRRELTSEPTSQSPVVQRGESVAGRQQESRSRGRQSRRQSQQPRAPQSGDNQRSDRTPRERSPSRQRAAVQSSFIPASLREHVESSGWSADGQVEGRRSTAMTVVEDDASVDSGSAHSQKVVAAFEDSDRDLPIQISSTDRTFSDPSQTIFMRQLRVEGVESEEALRRHVHRMFESLGYQVVNSEDGHVRFERGSVTFILALVPLFVLVLPLFVYLFLYCMGRSTIHQEPLELDVQFRKTGEGDDVYEIDLTFIGLHGVVLGRADQRVLNKEVDTLRDELQWALN